MTRGVVIGGCDQRVVIGGCDQRVVIGVGAVTRGW